MADKDGMERKVYLLPTELVERMRLYQTAEGIASEVEAARRLLNLALQLMDDLKSILKQLRYGFEQEKNLRTLANKVLSHHALVRSIQYAESDVSFETVSAERGRIDRRGVTYAWNDTFDDWTPEPPPVGKHKGKVPTWQIQRDSDTLDDEIPF